MARLPSLDVPKWLLALANNLYEIECKLGIHGDKGNALRNVEKAKESLEHYGIFYEDPRGQTFKETRTDLDATIVGTGTDNLVVVEVVKPIIRVGKAEFSQVVQKGIVVVESKTITRG